MINIEQWRASLGAHAMGGVLSGNGIIITVDHEDGKFVKITPCEFVKITPCDANNTCQGFAEWLSQLPKDIGLDIKQQTVPLPLTGVARLS